MRKAKWIIFLLHC